jgi:hypothetical protein
MAFLLKRDYFILIDSEDLNVVTYSADEGTTADLIIEETEANVIQEISSYLSGRYDVAKIFFQTGEPLDGETLNAGDFFFKAGKYYKALVDTSAEDLLTDETKFKIGDTRNALIKRQVIDIVLYELHSRINPRNIPEFRIQRRDDAIGWLKLVQNPRNNVDADFLPVKVFEPKTGNDISWNSKKKLTHDY